MTNEEICVQIQTAIKDGVGNTDLFIDLWEALYGFTCERSYTLYYQYISRFQSAGITPDDLIQHSYIIMYRAVQLYKPDTYKFISYYGKALLNGYLRLINGNHDKVLNNAVSFDKSLDDEEGNCLLDITADPDGEADIDNVVESEYQRALRSDMHIVLDMLSETERDILYKLYWREMTFDDIGKSYSMTYNEVKGIVDKALRKLRSIKIAPLLYKYVQEGIE